MRIVKVEYETNLDLLNIFLASAGNSLTTFRYFNKRPLSVIKNHLITYIGLDDNKTPICYGHLDYDNENRKIWLGICVKSSEIRKGYGSLMMDVLLDFAYKHNYFEIFLSVDKKNVNARRLYEKKGFKKIEENDKIVFYKIDLSLNSRHYQKLLE